MLIDDVFADESDADKSTPDLTLFRRRFPTDPHPGPPPAYQGREKRESRRALKSSANRPTFRQRRAALIAPLAALILAGCADSFMLLPSREVIPVKAQEMTMQTPVGAMQLWSVDTDPSAGEPEATVLGFTGNGSRAETDVLRFARYFQRHPVQLLVMNYPGFGASRRPAHLASIPTAALAVYDTVAADDPGKPVFVVGHSLGTTVALCVASHRPVSGLILHNPPPLKELIMGEFGWWNLWLAAAPIAEAIPDDMESLETETKVKAPAVFLLAGRDDLVEPPYQQMVVDGYPAPKQLIRLPTYGHNDPVTEEDLPNVLDAVDWMWARATCNARPATMP
jgi:pimeloyl-ACP methyl ester carboxylesterase